MGCGLWVVAGCGYAWLWLWLWLLLVVVVATSDKLAAALLPCLFSV